ncbi:MAG: helix-turn-helix transcriptional regulator [Kiritimatiellae bacterium]|nr:helix-turn-helix transcriptional regulator [Kiritimatiellia bacterium]
MNKTSSKMPIRQTTELRGLGAAALRCGVSHTHLRKVLQGERKPSAELARKMRRMGLKPGELAEGK